MSWPHIWFISEGNYLLNFTYDPPDWSFEPPTTWSHADAFEGHKWLKWCRKWQHWQHFVMFYWFGGCHLNKFEQVSSDGQQMSLAGGPMCYALYSEVQCTINLSISTFIKIYIMFFKKVLYILKIPLYFALFLQQIMLRPLYLRKIPFSERTTRNWCFTFN